MYMDDGMETLKVNWMKYSELSHNRLGERFRESGNVVAKKSDA